MELLLRMMNAVDVCYYYNWFCSESENHFTKSVATNQLMMKMVILTVPFIMGVTRFSFAQHNFHYNGAIIVAIVINRTGLWE